MDKIMQLHPTVCVVGNEYQIMIVTNCDALISVRVGDKTYYDHSNGIRKSSAGVHRVCVPSCVLDEECAYIVVAQEMIERLAYFPKIGSVLEAEYEFRPLKKTQDINIYHLSDVHGKFCQAVGAVNGCNREIDLFIMNGDISSTSNTVDDIILCYKIASAVTKGEIPCIISRGNHDLRGDLAETLHLYMPGDCGKSYYTFKVGCIWGILVDAGEDKDDSQVEYNATICCHDFRLQQQAAIETIVNNASVHYEAEDIKYRIVVSHIPFTFRRNPPFDIEKDIFKNWSVLIRDNIKPDLMLCGHTHKACISKNGSEYDELGQPCTIIVGADVTTDENNETILAGALVNLNGRFADVTVNTQDKILFEEKISLP